MEYRNKLQLAICKSECHCINDINDINVHQFLGMAFLHFRDDGSLWIADGEKIQQHLVNRNHRKHHVTPTYPLVQDFKHMDQDMKMCLKNQGKTIRKNRADELKQMWSCFLSCTYVPGYQDMKKHMFFYRETLIIWANESIIPKPECF